MDEEESRKRAAPELAVAASLGAAHIIHAHHQNSRVTELRGRQLEGFEDEGQLEDFLQKQIKRRKRVPKCVSKLRTFVRKVTLRHLERELRKRHTPLFQHKYKK